MGSLNRYSGGCKVVLIVKGKKRTDDADSTKTETSTLRCEKQEKRPGGWMEKTKNPRHVE